MAIKEFNNTYGEEFLLEYQKKALFKIGSHNRANLLLVSFPQLEGKYKNLINDLIKTNQSHFYYYHNLSELVIYDSEYHFIDGHPNREGHKKLAEDIYNYLIQNQLKTCM